MRAFVAACVVAIAIAAVGAVVLDQYNQPVESAFTTTSVRI